MPLITLKPEPEIAACETSTEALPVFVTLTVCCALLPTATLPKLTVVALAASTPAPVVGPVDEALV